MHLFSSERPEATPGRKAILVDGSVVPRVLVMPVEEGYELMVMLRCYDHGAIFSYSWHTATVPSIDDLGDFFEGYSLDPEATLLHYFAWKPQVWSQAEKPIIPTRKPTQTPQPTENMEDYL